MTNYDILNKWKQGLSKEKLAVMYKREYNQQIKISRADMKNRKKGKFISNYQALAYVEKIIYEYIINKY